MKTLLTDDTLFSYEVRPDGRILLLYQLADTVFVLVTNRELPPGYEKCKLDEYPDEMLGDTFDYLAEIDGCLWYVIVNGELDENTADTMAGETGNPDSTTVYKLDTEVVQDVR